MRMSKVALLHAVGAMAVAVTKNSTPDGHVEWVEPNGWADPVESFSFAGFTPSKVDKKRTRSAKRNAVLRHADWVTN